MNSSNGEQQKYTVLFFLYRDQDAASIKKQLPDDYQPANSTSYDPEQIDLCIIDTASWKANRDELLSIRESQNPVNVPIMLMGKADALVRMPMDVLQEVEQLLPTPLSKNMLLARLQNMRQNREQSLRMAKQNRTLSRFKRAMDSANSGIIITDQRRPDNPIIYANDTFCEMTGYDWEEIQGRNCRFLQGDDRNQEALGPLRKSIQNGEYCRVTLRNYTKEGKLFWNDLKVTPIQNNEEEVTHFLGIQNDITEKHRAEEKLKSEHHKFSQLFQHDSSAIAVFDTNGIIQSVNPAFENIFGYDEEEVVGKNIDYLRPQNEEERGHAEYLTKDHVTGMQQREVKRCDKEGNSIPVLLGGAPVREQEEVKFIFGIYTDIREQKRLEEENRELLEQERTLRARAEEAKAVFKDMFEHAPTAVALVEDTEHRFKYANEAYKRLINQEELKGKTVEEVLPELVDQGYIELLNQVYETGQPYEAEEKKVELKRSDGSVAEKYLNFVYKPLLDGEGQSYGILVVAVDVTDQIHYRTQLQRRLDEKTTLLAEIHHRVKNNLAVISGLLEMQRDDSEDEEVRGELSIAYSRIQSIALVHEQLYQEAESDAQINLKMYLPKLIDSLQKVTAANDKDISTVVHADDIFIPLDQAVTVGLMVSELLINAFKHAFRDKSQGKVEVTAEMQDKNLELRVSDDGSGLPEDFSMEESGGMGMQIVNTLLEQLVADLAYKSSPGEGSRFTVQIPLENENE